jgi:hypothetical protein
VKGSLAWQVFMLPDGWPVASAKGYQHVKHCANSEVRGVRSGTPYGIGSTRSNVQPMVPSAMK